MLVWTATLIFGIAVFAQAQLRMGGFVTALWMLTLFAIGFRMGRVGDRETLRQVNVAGLSLVVLGMQSIALAGKLLLRRMRLGAATAQFRLLADQLSSVTLAVLTKNKYQTGLWPAAAQGLSWVWATMMFFSFLFLMYLHLVSGPKGWLFLFLAVVVVGAAFWAGRNWFVGKSNSIRESTMPTSTGAGGEGDYRV